MIFVGFFHVLLHLYLFYVKFILNLLLVKSGMLLVQLKVQPGRVIKLTVRLVLATEYSFPKSAILCPGHHLQSCVWTLYLCLVCVFCLVFPKHAIFCCGFHFCCRSCFRTGCLWLCQEQISTRYRMSSINLMLTQCMTTT